MFSIEFSSSNRFDYSSPSSNSNQRQSASKKSGRDESEVSTLIFHFNSIDIHSQVPSHYDQLFDMKSACCICLAELSYDYNSGQTIIERNGIYMLAMLLFPENEEIQRLERFQHLQVNSLFDCLFILQRLFLADGFQSVEISISIE